MLNKSVNVNSSVNVKTTDNCERANSHYEGMSKINDVHHKS